MIRLSCPDVGEQELQAIATVFERAYLGMSKEVKAFEEELTDFLQMPTVCVNNGTGALQLALQACGIGRGDEVIVPSLTYVASFQAISATGANAVACDVDAHTGLMDLEDVKKRLTPRTKALMYVHYASQIGNRQQVLDFAQEKGLRLIEDAAHSFGHADLINAPADILCWSFDGLKNVTAGEGGGVSTNNQEVLSHIRDGRLLGVEGDSQKRFNQQRSWAFDVKHQGWRFHMSDVMAAIGRVQLRRFQELHQKRRAIVEAYFKAFRSMPWIGLFEEIASPKVSPYPFPVRVPSDQREAFQDFLKERGVETGRLYYPNHWLTFYKTPYELPQTDAIYAQLTAIPLNPKMTLEDAGRVIEVVGEFFKKL